MTAIVDIVGQSDSRQPRQSHRRSGRRPGGRSFGRAVVASGASTGAHEAVELRRDGDKAVYLGRRAGRS